MAREGSKERSPPQLGVCTVSTSMVRIGSARGSSSLNRTECKNFLVRIE
jgi:hypothetical protein